jgi:tRNA-specific 2-thiouridylase
LLREDKGGRMVRKVAKKLGIRFEVVALREEFKKQVIDYFCEAYGKGLTPNPCVICNEKIKFGELLKYARKLGYDYLATGHYAQVVVGYSDTFYHLVMAKAKKKDQSYFLYRLGQKELKHVLFPNGELLKTEVRKLAEKWNLPAKKAKESQEVCFLAGEDYREFLQNRIKGRVKPGEVVDIRGKVVGRHLGLPLYTIGQRSGFKIDHGVFGKLKHKVPVLYVIEKKVGKNQLIVGEVKKAEKRKFGVRDLSWVQPRINWRRIKNLRVKIRSQGKLLKGKIYKVKGRIRVVLERAERGIAAGQSVVFYKRFKRGWEVLGGGVIG